VRSAVLPHDVYDSYLWSTRLVGFMLLPILMHALCVLLWSILMLLLDTLLATTGAKISSLWLTVRLPKDAVTGVASGLHPWHAE
jgi:hypothetical protein